MEQIGGGWSPRQPQHSLRAGETARRQRAKLKARCALTLRLGKDAGMYRLHPVMPNSLGCGSKKSPVIGNQSITEGRRFWSDSSTFEVTRMTDNVCVETNLGPIVIKPLGLKSVRVSAAHLVINGLHVRVEASLFSENGVSFHVVRTYDQRNFNRVSDKYVDARTLDGPRADTITLDRITEILITAVNTLALDERRIFLEAERRALDGSIRAKKREIRGNLEQLETLKKKLTAVEAELGNG